MTLQKCSKCGTETYNHLDGLCTHCMNKEVCDGTYYQRCEERRKKVSKYLVEQISNGIHLFSSKDIGEVLGMTTKQVGSSFRILRGKKNNLYIKRESKSSGSHNSSKWWAEFMRCEDESS